MAEVKSRIEHEILPDGIIKIGDARLDPSKLTDYRIDLGTSGVVVSFASGGMERIIGLSESRDKDAAGKEFDGILQLARAQKIAWEEEIKRNSKPSPFFILNQGVLDLREVRDLKHLRTNVEITYGPDSRLGDGLTDRWVCSEEEFTRLQAARFKWEKFVKDEALNAPISPKQIFCGTAIDLREIHSIEGRHEVAAGSFYINVIPSSSSGPFAATHSNDKIPAMKAEFDRMHDLHQRFALQELERKHELDLAKAGSRDAGRFGGGGGGGGYSQRFEGGRGYMAM